MSMGYDEDDPRGAELRRSMAMGTATKEEWHLFHEIEDMDGYEYPAAQMEYPDSAGFKLKARGVIEVSEPRGPNNAWVRLTIADNYAIP